MSLAGVYSGYVAPMFLYKFGFLQKILTRGSYKSVSPETLSEAWARVTAILKEKSPSALSRVHPATLPSSR